MTHVYAYIKEGYTTEQIKAAIDSMKASVCEGFNLATNASTIAVKEMAADSASDNLGAFVLVYTARNKGLDLKKRFAKQLSDGLKETLPGIGEVKMVMKEQATDMVGYNGVLRCNRQDILSDFEIGK